MKHPFRLLAAAALILSAAGCGNKPVKPEFGSVETDTLFTCGATQYSVQYSFTTILNADTSPALQAIEEANIRYFYGLEEFTGTAEEAAETVLAELRHEAEADAGSEFGWENTESMQSEAAIVDTLLVYTITSASYTGGAHGNYGIAAHNYSLNGGYELTLADLFDDAQRESLDRLIRSKLYEQFNVADDEGLALEGFFPEYIGAAENFAVSEEGVTFYYNPYDIGCYALGDLEITVSRDELETL